MKAQRNPGTGSGFTLIEVVVSLAILALALGVLYESFGWSMRRAAVLDAREGAWLTAQSLLADIRGRDGLRVGTERGETADGFKWESRISLHDMALDARSSIKAFDVTIDVSWGSRPPRRVRLQSVETSRIAS